MSPRDPPIRVTWALVVAFLVLPFSARVKSGMRRCNRAATRRYCVNWLEFGYQHPLPTPRRGERPGWACPSPLYAVSVFKEVLICKTTSLPREMSRLCLRTPCVSRPSPNLSLGGQLV